MTANKPDQPVLLVEDSAEDYETAVRAFKKAGLVNPLFRCRDGDEALDFLYQRGVRADGKMAPRPALVLLDLNLPGSDGRDVLREIKHDDSLRSIPVVVFTTSSNERDVEACYRAGANGYIHKPLGFEEFVETARQLKKFWFEVVLLPKVD